MNDVFISYKREERDIARLLADALEARGWSVWWDPKLRAGEHFDDVIEDAIKNARCVIVLWSTRSIKSRYVKDEASYALKLEKLVPVAIDNTSPPFRFQGLHTIQLQGWAGSALSPAFQELLKDIEKKLGRPAAPTTEHEPSLWSEPSAEHQAKLSMIRNDPSLSVEKKALLMIKAILGEMDQDILHRRTYLDSIRDNPELVRVETTKLECMLAKRDEMSEVIRNMERGLGQA